MPVLRNQWNPKRLAIEIVEQNAISSPDKVFAEIPRSASDFEQGFQSITYVDLANAVNGVAWYLRNLFGSPDNIETLTYIGPNDLSHVLLILGAVKAGFKMLFTSPRYSPLAQAKLLELTQCQKVLVCGSGSREIAESIASVSDVTLQIHSTPSIWTFLNAEHQLFPHTKTFDQAWAEPLVVLHTSGTTGFPKPVIWTHGWAAAFAFQLNLQPPEGFQSNDVFMLHNRMFSLMPPFHGSGLFANLIFPLWCNSTVLLPPSGLVPSIKIAVDVLQWTKIDVIACVPPYLEDLATKNELLDTLAQHDSLHILWGGGVISKTAGDIISSKLALTNVCGSTETGAWPRLRKGDSFDRSDWASLSLHPAAGIEFRKVTADIHTAIITKNKPLTPGEAFDCNIQPLFHVYTDLEEYDTKDLFVRDTRPEKEHLWHWYGRSDDLQVCITGEKLHPAAVEKELKQTCPVINEVILELTGLPKSVLLIELKPNVSRSDQNVLETIWKTVERANGWLPSYAKIGKEQMIFLEGETLLPRTVKGTIQRRQAAILFKAEVDAALQNVNSV